MEILGVAITCHNRKELTLRCIESLVLCDLPKNFQLKIYLTDDGCSDGTTEAVAETFPQVSILKGNGNLFWGGGMRLAMEKALSDNVDCILWLNDDVVLNRDALVNGLELLCSTKNALVVGTTVEPGTDQLTYGGLKPAGFGRATSFKVIPPQQGGECSFMSGQFVLFRSSVTKSIGLIDPVFRHSFGDIDFGLRARKAGFALLLLPKIVGTCSTNSAKDYWKQPERSLKEFLNKLNSPKGLPPKERLVYCRRHCGVWWWWHFLSPYALYALTWPRYVLRRR